MKSYREELWFQTKERREYLNITSHVERVVQQSHIQEGFVLVNACISPPVSIVMMIKLVCCMAMNSFLKDLCRRQVPTGIIEPEKTMAMLI